MGPEMNYELLLGLKPDVVLLYGIGDAQTAVTDKLKELFIPYMYVGEYLEESPLGKAEWLVALSELTDSRKKGIEIFREIPKTLSSFESAHRIGRATSYRYAQYPVERQLGDAFHTKLYGTIGN